MLWFFFSIIFGIVAWAVVLCRSVQSKDVCGLFLSCGCLSRVSCAFKSLFFDIDFAWWCTPCPPLRLAPLHILPPHSSNTSPSAHLIDISPRSAVQRSAAPRNQAQPRAALRCVAQRSVAQRQLSVSVASAHHTASLLSPSLSLPTHSSSPPFSLSATVCLISLGYCVSPFNRDHPIITTILFRLPSASVGIITLDLPYYHYDGLPRLAPFSLF